jgi:transposase-like protein
MANATHTEARYNNEDAAREHLESIRWPDGPVCLHCGGVERNSQLQGKSHRNGLYFCGDCRQQFTVTIGTVFEDSKVPLHKWLYANHLICASKKGISSKQLERVLKVSYKTAWFMSHRLRKAMETGYAGPLGGNGGAVEVDETYWGNEGKQAPGARGWAHKMKVVSLVERDGQKRSFHVTNVTAKVLRPILKAQVSKKAHLMTDEAKVYKPLGKDFKKHSSVNHSAGEYARGNVTTNSVESSFAILKRGLYGTFHSVSEKHLQRYATEFDFKWNHREKLGFTDEDRADIALKGISGKRLMYNQPNQECQS